MSKSSIKCEDRGDAEQSRWSQLLDHVCLWTSEGRHEAIFTFCSVSSPWFLGLNCYPNWIHLVHGNRHALNISINILNRKNRTEAKLLLSLAQYSAMMAWRSRNPETTTRWHGENDRSNRNDDRNGNNKKIQKEERKKTNNYLRSLRISKKKQFGEVWRICLKLP
jgi:hypothetical protein